MSTDWDARKKATEEARRKFAEERSAETHRQFVENQRRFSESQRKVFPNWRADVKVEDVPILWQTNLCDDELRELYLLLKTELRLGEEEPEAKAEPLSGGIVIRLPPLIQKWVNFKDGACWVIGLKSRDSLWLCVMYRTSLDWELWNAHRQEVEELREEQRLERQAESELFKAQDQHLKQQVVESLNRKAYNEIPALFKLRFELRNQYKHLRVGAYDVKRDAMQVFRRFPTTEAGIEFLQVHTTLSGEYQRFAEQYLFWNAGKVVLKNGVLSHEKFARRDDLIAEVDTIFRAAIRRFPVDSLLYARVCRFWRRNSQISLAIEYCQLAIDRGLNDGSKSGFVGCLKRLRKQAGLIGS